MPPIKSCRVCKSKKLKDVLSLGEHFYTGIFPKKKKLTSPEGYIEFNNL